jgi:hypothetical protein
MGVGRWDRKTSGWHGAANSRIVLDTFATWNLPWLLNKSEGPASEHTRILNNFSDSRYAIQTSREYRFHDYV